MEQIGTACDPDGGGLRLAGRLVWVTGASRGLGLAITARLVAEGATVYASARDEGALVAAAHQFPPRTVVPLPGSVVDESHVDRVLEAVEGELHGLVNCAGISPSFSRTEELESAVLRQILEVNTIGTFLCTRAAGRRMLTQAGGGSIVNVSSVHGRVGHPRIAAYAASKGAVDAFTASVAVEWADRKVRVNAIAPGYFETDLSRGLLRSDWGDRIRSATPMGRTGQLDEVGGAVAFLLSDDASFVTGATLSVDGGWQAW